MVETCRLSRVTCQVQSKPCPNNIAPMAKETIGAM